MGSPSVRWLWIGMLIAGFGCAAVPGSVAYDPVSMDPPLDREHPGSIAETAFVSGGARLNAIVYEARGPGPHPTLLLLHGFPGNERNLDLAQAVRRAGWNAVFFHYRGAWGSGGDFSFAHVLEDVAAVADQVSRSDFAAAHRIDPSRLALVGHSMGGFAALAAGAELEGVDCIASIAGANPGVYAQVAATPEAAQAMATRLDGWAGPLSGARGADLVAEISANADAFDTRRHAAALAPRALLLVAGIRDEVLDPAHHHEPLVAALRAAGAESLREERLDSDHSLSDRRIALARVLVDWLQTDCRSAAGS